MEMVVHFQTSFVRIGLRSSLRLGARYRYFIDRLDATVFPRSQLEPLRIIDMILPFQKAIAKKGTLAKPMILIELQDVQSKTSALISENTVTKIGSNKIVFDDSDLLIAKIEPELGKVLLNRKNKDVIGSTEWIPLKVRNGTILPVFLKYVLLNPKVLNALGLLKSGKIQARLPMEELLQLKLPVPSLDRQKALEPILLDNDCRITELSKSLESISRICDAIFFKTYKINLNHQISSRFTTSFSDIGLNRLIRIGFRQGTFAVKMKQMECTISKWVSLSSVAKVRGGKRLKKGTGYSQEPTSYRYLRNIDLSDGEINLHSVKFITEKQQKSIENYQVFENEIVMAIAGTVGKLALVTRELGTCNVTENLAVISPDKSVVPQYLLYLLSSSIVQIQIQKEMSELRQQKLGLAKVRGLKIPKPPDKPTQEAIAKQISVNLGLMRARKIKIQNLLNQAIDGVELAIVEHR